MLVRTVLFLLILLCSLSPAFAQAIKLTGKVVNDKNEPLAGVSIKITEGGGTTSNVDGYFTLTLAPGKKYELTFTAVGYAPKELTDVEVVAGQPNELTVLMTVAAQNLGGETEKSRSSARREPVMYLYAFHKITNTVDQLASSSAIRT